MAKEKENKVKNSNKHFMKDVKAELKKVAWPTSKQMVSNVSAVITIVLVTAIIVFCLDFIFGAMNKYGVDKLKEKVQSNNQSQTQIDETTTTDEQSGDSDESANSEENAGDTDNVDNTENSEDTDSVETTDNNENNENNDNAENTDNSENTENE